MIFGKSIEKVIDFVGEVLAMGTLVLIVVLYLSNKFGWFIPADRIEYWSSVRSYAIVAVVGLKALEFAVKRNIIIAIVLFVIIAAAVTLGMLP